MSYIFADVGFAIPWKRNHCVPLAFTAARDGDTAFAISLADSAKRTPNPDAFRRHLLNPAGGSVSFLPPTPRWSERWAALAGLRIVGVRCQNVEPTVAQFAREDGKSGRWVLMTRRHALSVVNGKIRGWYKPRARVVIAWRVEIITPQENA